MKKIYVLFVAVLATTYAGIIPVKGQGNGLVTDTVLLNPGYTHEVYYNLASGVKSSALRGQWDIAFRTSIQTASIITNDGSGVMLYTYPKADTSGWATLDTAGISGWKPLYNSLTDWELGAFNTYSKGMYDYGWGVYNISTHNLTGDSLYVIKLRNGEFRKLWIVGKASAFNKTSFRYAGLDGLAEHKVIVDCNPYISKNFLGYSLSDNVQVDFEPADASTWDLLFTKYMGLSGTTPYSMTGVLSNYNTAAAKYHPVALDFGNWVADDLDSSRSAIGADWKYYESSIYHIEDSTVYFVQDKGGNLYKLVFKEFTGSSLGRVVFTKQKVSALAIVKNQANDMNLVVFPNPVSDMLNLFVGPGRASVISVSLLDVSGRKIMEKLFEVQPETMSTLSIPTTDISAGIYLIKMHVNGNTVTRKIIVNN